MKTLAPIGAYLASDTWIDTADPHVARVAHGFTTPQEAYHFVRDHIAHSYDIRASEVTATAPEVLAVGHGICYAKAHLLAALLRAMGIPAGLAYQRLVLFDDPADGYSLHAVNTVYLADEDRWVRVDARGNKPGVFAEFSVTEERLAFPVRPELGEVDYPWNFATPPEAIQRFYNQPGDISDLYARCLPDVLEPPTAA
jgi:transglutaminase-like putative cysteine protease